MVWLSLLFRNPIGKMGALLGAIGLLVAAVFVYGKTQYREGVRDTTAEFVENDLQGAAEIRDKAESVLRELGGVSDPDELLRSTGGLRD